MTDALSIGTTVAYGPLLVALLVAMVAGMISFLSPCCLPLVPGYLAYVPGAAGADAADDVRVQTRSTALVGTPPFVLGFAAVFTSYGTLFGTLGGTLIRHQDLLIRSLATLTISLGLMFRRRSASCPACRAASGWATNPRPASPALEYLESCSASGLDPWHRTDARSGAPSGPQVAQRARGPAVVRLQPRIGNPVLRAASGISRAFRAFDFARAHARAVMCFGGAMLVTLGVLEVTGIWGTWLASPRTLISTWQVPP